MKPFLFIIMLISFSCVNPSKEKQNSIKEDFKVLNDKLDKNISDIDSKSTVIEKLVIDKEKKSEETILDIKPESKKVKINKVLPNNKTTRKSESINYVQPKKNKKVIPETAPTSISKEISKIVSETKPTNVDPKEEVKITSTPELTLEPETSNPVEIKSIPPTISNKTWGVLLNKYVDNKGNVDYYAFKKDEKKLYTYLNYLANSKPSGNNSKNEKLAYYINLYNAATVKLILDNYPTKSIKDIKSPWDKKWVKVGNETLSLGYIEHKILRKMDEPRIHFAINCASYSCPQLLNTVFTANNMEQKLEQATKGFINDTSRNQFGEKIGLSRIFKWYKNDFTDNGSLLEYIKSYTNKEIDTEGKVTYLNYDWSLNEKK